MRYWDEDQPELDVFEIDFAAAWRAKPKWVVSRPLKSVLANATLVAAEIEAPKPPLPPPARPKMRCTLTDTVPKFAATHRSYQIP